MNYPIILIEQYYTQLFALNNKIAGRQEQPWPNKEEGDTIRILTSTIAKITGLLNKKDKKDEKESAPPPSLAGTVWQQTEHSSPQNSFSNLAPADFPALSNAEKPVLSDAETATVNPDPNPPLCPPNHTATAVEKNQALVTPVLKNAERPLIPEPPAHRISPFRVGNVIWINHIDDLDDDNYKMGDIIQHYPKQTPA